MFGEQTCHLGFVPLKPSAHPSTQPQTKQSPQDSGQLANWQPSTSGEVCHVSHPAAHQALLPPNPNRPHAASLGVHVPSSRQPVWIISSFMYPMNMYPECPPRLWYVMDQAQAENKMDMVVVLSGFSSMKRMISMLSVL